MESKREGGEEGKGGICASKEFYENFVKYYSPFLFKIL
jgi:hypothetical protein